MSTRTIRSAAPARDELRRYGPIRRERLGTPAALVLLSGGLILAALTLIIGMGLIGDLAGGLVSAVNGAMAKLSSQAPATAAASGVALDTPSIDTPDNDGYTNQPSLVITGDVPAAAAGEPGYSIIVYRVGSNGARSPVAQVPVGATTRYSTPAITLTEGSNVFIATLDAQTGEGQPSPPVTFILDTTPPALKVTSPANNLMVNASSVNVVGQTDAGATVSIRNEEAPGGAGSNTTAGSDGSFKLTVPVVAGPNSIDLTAVDQAGNATNASITIYRSYGQMSPHLSASPTKFSASTPTSVTLTVHVTSASGAPLAGASVTFTVTVHGLGPIVSPTLTTNSNGVAQWQVTVSGGTAGQGQASVLAVSPAGDQVRGTVTITTT